MLQNNWPFQLTNWYGTEYTGLVNINIPTLKWDLTLGLLSDEEFVKSIGVDAFQQSIYIWIYNTKTLSST